MKVKPLADRVLVKPEKLEAKTAGGIIIPDTAQEKTQTAVVVPLATTRKNQGYGRSKVLYEKIRRTAVKMTEKITSFSKLPTLLP